ncbi:Rab-GTPase-TBC domain [Macleaya cordata]|uniref:Rab-GTPase-TBC domain n=1 Tax=Macleaya cordata TaxID=56857 RepID=A0A200QHP7_MACCD|nr:Rab-GTPase-TBC domain [Macleaya cordata]
MKEKKSLPFHTSEHKRDTYGFVVRPQHLKRYQEYANIYKEEEEERSDRWNHFLERQAFSAQLNISGLSKEGDNTLLHAEASEREATTFFEKGVEEDESSSGARSGSDGSTANVPESEEAPEARNAKTHKIQIWTQIRSSLGIIEQMMSIRVTKSKKILKNEQDARSGNHLSMTEEDSEDEFYDVERSEPNQDATLSDSTSVSSDGVSPESFVPWKEELECLVRGGVPMALRGELWQAFVGVRARRVGRYYQDLLALGTNTGDDKEHGSSLLDKTSNRSSTDHERSPEQWKGQIEKDLPRTFPGHPALDEDGRNALRRLLTAYARHNPSVGYCQAMNFFAGLLLLLMPEENAFWTLVGIIDDYFDGYYSEEMIESQVDQLVFEELVRERFPKLVNHLDYLGVQVAWFTGPWFLSIFVNMLPWESVLRVWDVLLFEGNRVMLFRTALALMEFYGSPALVTTKDAGDAITLLQSLTGSTFDSSQLVLTACMGYQAINETRLQQLRDKHRPSVTASLEERSKGLRVMRGSQGLASNIYNLKHDPGSKILKTNTTEGISDTQSNGNVSVLEYGSTNLDDFLNSLTGNADLSSAPDRHEQVASLKVEICILLEDKRSAILRAEELETALVEMVKQDNRRQLSEKVEMLEQEVAQLQQAIADKQEQEEAMLKVLMQVEQEQRETEDARILAEQDVAAQRDSARVLQAKYEEALALFDQMEKRVIMAESMLEATLQYQSGQVKGLKSPSLQLPCSISVLTVCIVYIPSTSKSGLGTGSTHEKNQFTLHIVRTRKNEGTPSIAEELGEFRSANTKKQSMVTQQKTLTRAPSD